MEQIKFSIRSFIDKRTSVVMIRVRWMNKKREVGFSTGVYAQEDKWIPDLQKAKKNTTHIVRGMHFTASQINERIAEYREIIESCFREFAEQGFLPSTDQLKAMVHQEMGTMEETVVLSKRKSFKELFDEFIKVCSYEKNWDKLAIEKYNQAYMHITSANPGITPDSICVQSMHKLRDWYIAKGYKNRTMNKQVVMVKAILRWIDQQDGYSIPASVLKYQTNLKVIPKTVTFLNFDELMAFYKYPFDDIVLSNARDLWCFMAFTSLRFSDLNALRTVHIIDGKRIEMFAQKTDGRLSIPLNEYALALIAKHKPKAKPGRVFNSISNQKLNDHVKEAAKIAGLDREILNSYYVGTTRHDDVVKFYDIISCHDARRTFVSCSLAMGITAEVVMKCTGHTDYKTMKPYIATITETQTKQIEKWNISQYRSIINERLDSCSKEDLIKIMAAIDKVIQHSDIAC